MTTPSEDVSAAAVADDPWLGANPLDPAFRDDPYPALHRLRSIAPVHCTPLGFWRLTRYADVVRLLRDVPDSAFALPPALASARRGWRVPFPRSRVGVLEALDLRNPRRIHRQANTAGWASVFFCYCALLTRRQPAPILRVLRVE